MTKRHNAKPAATARGLAISALLQLAEKHSSLAMIWPQLLARHTLAARDQQLARAITSAVLRQRNQLDAVLDHFSKKPVARLTSLVRAALRTGCAQLLCLERIPASAAVNETVKGMGRQAKWLKGFVNGVLRAISRQPDQARIIMTNLPWPEKSNHPTWITSLLEKQYGRERAAAICAANNQPPCLHLRINSRLTSTATFKQLLTEKNIACQTGSLPETMILPHYNGTIPELPGYDEGLFHVQDQGAQLIGHLLFPFVGGACLDACAGVGGKTILLDQLLPDNAAICAIEPQKERFRRLQTNLARSRCRPIELHQCALADFASQSDRLWQAILLDAPCSGLGVMGRQPDIRWNRRESDLADFQRQQRRLLRQAARLLAPDGLMVYATCSLARQENEEVIAAFLAEHTDFTIHEPTAGQVRPFLTEEGFFRSLPSQESDGFFACVLRNQHG